MKNGDELISDARGFSGNEEGRLREYYKLINFGEANKKGNSYGIKKEEIRERIQV
jgi:hypothetical protein